MIRRNTYDGEKNFTFYAISLPRFRDELLAIDGANDLRSLPFKRSKPELFRYSQHSI